MRKKLLAALLALACIVLPTQFANAATDYSTVRVRLSSSLDDLNIGVNGLYLLPEGNLTVTSDINVRLDSSKTALVVTQNGAQIYSGSSFQLIRSADPGRQVGPAPHVQPAARLALLPGGYEVHHQRQG